MDDREAVRTQKRDSAGRRGSFLEGALILSAAGVLSKVIGAGAKVALVRFVLGAEGIGLYQMAYPIYTIILTVSRAGIPVSLSKLIAGKTAREDREGAFDVFRVALSLSVVLGVLLGALLFLSAGPIASILGDARAYYALVVLAPAVFLVSIMAALRGYFQGQQRMLPTGLSQVVEQIVRVATMLVLGYLLIDYGVEMAAAGATFGAVSGAAAGLAVLAVIYLRGGRGGQGDRIASRPLLGQAPDWPTFRSLSSEIMSLALPVSFGALVLPLMRTIDAIIVPHRLISAGFAVSEATTLFGDFAGMAMVLVDFPSIVTVALSVSLVPAISEAYSVNDMGLVRARTRKALRFTAFLGLPSAFGLSILAEPISALLFNRPEAAVPLSIVAFGVIFIGLQQTSSGILQGLGRTRIPAFNLFYGAVLNAVLNYFLTAVPVFNIRGAALGTLVGFGIAAALNLWALNRFVDLVVDVRTTLFKPLLAVAVMVGALQIVYYGLHTATGSGAVSTLSAIGTGALVYGFMLLVTGAVGREELLLVPYFGNWLAERLQGFGPGDEV